MSYTTGKVPVSQIQQIKEATDIVQLLGERLTLQRSGTNWRGLCPFHGEKSPSFFVNEQFQRYKCFGCGEAGDVFTFLEKYDGMTFGEALKYLADRAGIVLESVTPDPAEAKRHSLLGILDLAKDYYHYLLTEHKLGEPARAYLKERGVTQESIKLFRMGYALPTWDGLIQYLHGKKKFELYDLLDAGLIVSGQRGRHYDRFRDRIMFPLTNHRGQVVGFSGRLLSGDAKEAKYINTPETLLYHKSQMLFGLSELYQPIRTAKEVVVVEGEFDVISSAQAHVSNVVAIKGSALTTDHARLLSRVADRVLLSLDMDKAGVEATKRAISVVKNTALELRVIQIPSGKDPDELARHNPAEWRQAVKASVSVYDFFLSAATRAYNPQTPEGKRKIVQELAPILDEIPLIVEKEVYVKRLAELLGTTPLAVSTDIARLVRDQAARSALKKPTGSPAGTSESTKPPAKSASNLETYVLYLLLQSSPSQLQKRAAQLQPQWFTDSAARHFIIAASALTTSLSVPAVIKALADDVQQALFDVYLDPDLAKLIVSADIDAEWVARLAALRLQAAQAELTQLTTQLKTLEKRLANEPELQAEYDTILQHMVTIQQQGRG